MPKLPWDLTLRGAGVTLRDWRDEDAPALEPVCGQWDVCQFTTVPWTYTLAEARAWIARQHERRADGTGVALAITASDDDDEPVGNVNLVGFSDDGRRAALGYWLVPQARGQGLATRAARTLCDWGFATLGLQRIELAILPENAASQAVATRLGARNEGLRADSHEAGGRNWDMVIYALTRPPAH